MTEEDLRSEDFLSQERDCDVFGDSLRCCCDDLGICDAGDVCLEFDLLLAFWLVEDEVM